MRLLTGLEAWGVSKPKKDGEDAKSPSVKPDRKRSSKHDSVAKKAVKQELTAPGAESLLCRSLTAEDIRSADYYSFVEVLVGRSAGLPSYRPDTECTPCTALNLWNVMHR